MHAPWHLLLDPPECLPHAIAPGDPLHEKLPTAVAFANEGKAREAEDLRLAASALSVRLLSSRNSIRRVLAGGSDSENSANRSRNAVPESSGIGLILNADDKIA